MLRVYLNVYSGRIAYLNTTRNSKLTVLALFYGNRAHCRSIHMRLL